MSLGGSGQDGGVWFLYLNLKHFFNLFDLYSRKVIVLQQDSHSNSVDYPQRGSVSFWNLVAHGRQCFIQTRTNVIIYALLREEQLFCQLMSHLEKCFFLPIYSSWVCLNYCTRHAWHHLLECIKVYQRWDKLLLLPALCALSVEPTSFYFAQSPRNQPVSVL